MLPRFSLLTASAVLGCLVGPCIGQVSPQEWGAPPVRVSHAAGKWTIAGTKNTATLDEKDLSLTVQAGAAAWKMMPSSDKDMLVRAFDDEFPRAPGGCAREIGIVEYRTGFKTGVKITLDGFRANGVRAPGAPARPPAVPDRRDGRRRRGSGFRGLGRGARRFRSAS